MKEKVMKYKGFIALIGIIIVCVTWRQYNAKLKQGILIEEHRAQEEVMVEGIEEENVEETLKDIEQLNLYDVVSEESKLGENLLEVPIYICGAVQMPGVYYVPQDAIINDILLKCGGFTKEADQTAINLAGRIVANEKIIIPKQGEKIDKFDDSYENRERIEGLPSSQITSLSSNEESSVSHNALVNLNTATKEELMTLNGIGEVKAEAIIVYRQENGGFKSVEEIMQISGVGEKIYDKIKQFITTE